ncbi:unnamed protein product [Mytilus coruscus]|uniref:Integrase zinc-binding domain-containing protein n=1 Tax=Mytilus coruscus TaxID=42192 RepID=A0A6J8CVV7_MYTCO|nr:unnamed protein product [Mytilus coruscus]
MTLKFSTWFQNKSLTEIAESQDKDYVLSDIINLKEIFLPGQNGKIFLNKCPEIKAYWSLWNMLVLRNKILYYKFIETDNSVRLTLVLPQNLKSEILTMLHNDSCSGHLGINRTLARIRSRFFWPNLKQDVTRWCETCSVYQRRKGPYRKAKAGMKQYLVGAPLERVAIDIMGPLPLTWRKNKYIMVVTDYFTRSVRWASQQQHDCLPTRNKYMDPRMYAHSLDVECHSQTETRPNAPPHPARASCVKERVTRRAVRSQWKKDEAASGSRSNYGGSGCG